MKPEFIFVSIPRLVLYIYRYIKVFNVFTLDIRVLKIKSLNLVTKVIRLNSRLFLVKREFFFLIVDFFTLTGNFFLVDRRLSPFNGRFFPIDRRLSPVL